MMPLSEHEQRLLDEIEQALYAEDPKFASSVRSARPPSRLRRSIALGILGVLAGLGLVLVGLLANLIFLSVIGFVLVVSCTAWEISTIRGRRSAPAVTSTTSRSRRSGTLRSRMEDRMRRRFDEN
jgi:hypothetical protein